MPIFELQGPDGKTYEVDAPDMGAAAQAFSGMAPASVGDMSVRNVATAAARGVPILGGLVDEAVAGGQSLLGYGDYEGNLKAEQERHKAFDTAHPYVSGAAQIAGGVAGSLPMVMAAPGFFGAGAASLAARAGLGVISGGTIGGADQYVRSDGDWKEAAKGAGTGAFFGAAAPVAGNIAGKAYNSVLDAAEHYLGSATNPLTGIPRNAAEYAVDMVRSPGRAQTMVQDLQRLGPDAMLADVSPEWMMMARGAATRPGQRDPIVNALLERDAGKNARLAGDLDASLGRPEVPSRVDAAIEVGQDALSPQYTEALRHARTPDTQALAYELDDFADSLRGPAQKAIVDVRRMLNVRGTDVLDPDPASLLNTRWAIDGLLEKTDNSKVTRALTQARRSVDEILTDAVPGIKEVDAQWAELARQRTALQRGSTVLDTGKTAPRPQELADEVAAGALPQGMQIGPSAVPFRMQQGTRAEMDRLVGQAANDPAKLQQVVKSEGDWNRDKLRTLFGQERADDALNAIDRETVFYRTKNRVENGSDTAMAEGASDFLNNAAKPNSVSTEATVTGLLLRGAQKGLQAMLQSDGEARAAKYAADLGRLATARGPERDRAMQAIVDALARRNIMIPRSASVEQVMNALVRAGGLQAGEAVGSR